MCSYSSFIIFDLNIKFSLFCRMEVLVTVQNWFIFSNFMFIVTKLFLLTRIRKQEKNAYISSNERNYSSDVTRFVIEDATSTTSHDCYLFNNIKLSFSFIFICLNNYQNSINSHDCLIHNQFFWIKSLYGSIKRIWGEKRQKKKE